jgi:hypothetical protein
MVQSQYQHSPHLTETQARQGFRGRHALVVLIASVALAAIVLALVWGSHARELATVDANHATRVAATQGVAVPAKPRPMPIQSY